MATVISVINIKGGTAKTTTTFNLGAALAARNKRILTVDSDSQGSLTKAMGFTPLNCKVSLATLMCQALDSPELLEPGIKQAILHQNNIDLLPANQKLSGIATRLSVMQATASMFGEQDDIQPVYVLKTIVDMLRSQYDYILIDCSPHPDLQIINAIAASDEVIIPVQAHYLNAEGLPDTLELVRRVRAAYQPNLFVYGLLLTMYKGRTLLAKAVKEQIEEDYGTQIHVFAQPIDYSIRVAEHSAYGESILDYAPDCPTAKSYAMMAEEVLSHE